MAENNSANTDVTNSDLSGMLNYSAIKSKILCGEFKISSKRGRSKVWSTFGKIEKASGDDLPDIVACRRCNNIYKYNSKSTSNLVKHRCYSVTLKQELKTKIDVDIENKKKIIDDITEWTISNCRPFELVQDSGFKKVAECLLLIGSKYGPNVNLELLLPFPTTISKKLNNVYNICFKKINNEIAAIKSNGFGLTSDLWTDNFLKKTYVTLTIHYVKEGDIVTRFLGMKCMESERCTSENISLKATKLLHEFHLELNDKAIIVTDKSSKMVAAFEKNNHMFCINHLMDDVLQKSMKEVTEVANLSRSCKKIVNYFKFSGLNSKLNTTLESFSPTRWNTIYYEFVAIESNWEDIMQILQQNKELKRISNINLKLMKALIKILEEFEKASKKLEGELYPTIHLVYFYVYRLKTICSTDTADTRIIKNFKEKLRTYLDSIVFENLTTYHKIALFLFPPFNTLIKFNHEEKQSVIQECKKLMKSYQELQDERQSDQSGNAVEISNESNELFSEFLPRSEISNSNDKICSEISTYQDIKTQFHDDFNILQWWSVHRKQLPLLFKVSCKILATPASSSASDRIFLAGRSLISEKRSSIASSDYSINQIMFLHFNLGEHELQTNINEQ